VAAPEEQPAPVVIPAAHAYGPPDRVTNIEIEMPILPHTFFRAGPRPLRAAQVAKTLALAVNGTPVAL
jgi:hypothetical protein